jgi:hypothetical protein
MKKYIAMAWCEALESGEYEQGEGRLRNEQNEFCCLGILCNMHAQAKLKLSKEQTNPNEYFGNDQYPPAVVWKTWAGMKTNDGSFIEGVDEDGFEDSNDLANLNDGGESFAEIAKIIRKHYKEL